jgi:hypothetical protein
MSVATVPTHLTRVEVHDLHFPFTLDMAFVPFPATHMSAGCTTTGA